MRPVMPTLPIISSLFRPHGCSSTRLAHLLPDVVDSASNRGILNGFRAFSDLSLQKCVPCNRKDLKPMTEQTANVLKPKVPEWELLIDGVVMKLCRKWKVKNFLQGLELFKVVGDLAEAEGGLTENDFILAAKINKLPLESYLRRK